MHGLVCERDLVNYERCYLYLTPETLKKCGFNKIDLCLQFESACSSKKITQQLTEQEGKKILELIKEIEQRGMKNTQDYNNLLEDFSSILNILNVAQRLSCEESILVKANTTNNAMYKVLHYINQNFTEEISIDKLSHQFNMSESALSHEFRKYSNKSVYEYVLYKRIIKAKELLITDSSLTQIALDCGFNDYSNFLRVFKKISNSSLLTCVEYSPHYTWTKGYHFGGGFLKKD